jgi:hypothetical protein
MSDEAPSDRLPLCTIVELVQRDEGSEFFFFTGLRAGHRSRASLRRRQNNRRHLGSVVLMLETARY